MVADSMTGMNPDAEERFERLCRELDFTATDLPLPPPQLRLLVAGTTDLLHFLELGRAGAQCIIELLSTNGMEITSFKDILDFGCGCGRVLRYLAKMIDRPVHGTDCNDQLVAWLSNALPRGRIYLNGPAPPTEHDSESFDLIYGLSVLTHWPEQQQIAWMAEFARILKPGGCLIVTTHGDHPDYMRILTEEERDRFSDGQLVVRRPELAGSNECFAIQSDRHVRRVLGSHWRILDFRRYGARGNPHQDVYLLTK
jgi:SAM-dependent methyltransferase